jgi:hypothetical protein
MKIFNVEIEGLTPLLHHRMSEEALMALLGVKEKKKKPKELRTPREIAEEHAYKTPTGEFYIPMGYISGAFAHVSSDYKQSTSSRKSIKAIAGGVFRPMQEAAILTDAKGKPLKNFEVDIKKATNHKAGAVCVCRPRFDRWRTTFQIQIDDSILSQETALQILEDSGRRAGIGSFRVAKGGYYGQFQVVSWKEIKGKNVK